MCDLVWIPAFAGMTATLLTDHAKALGLDDRARGGRF
jgi:hypothetical protein